MHENKPARRAVLATVGALCSSALAGCSGSDTTETEGGGNEDTTEGQSSDSESSESTNEQSQETDTQNSEYPSEEAQSDVEKRTFSNAEENDEEYAIKIDDFDYINQDQLESSDDETINNYSEALNEAITPELEGDDSLLLYFPEPSVGRIDFLRNPERSFSEFANNPPNTVSGVSEEFDQDAREAGGGVDPELAKSEYAEFISERLDGDGIVNHAGEIPEYAREALESGWQAQ